MIEHFRFLKSVAKAVPKMTIPSPTALHFRGGRQAIEKSVYPEMEPFFEDLGKAYTKAVHAFGEAGCTYLQLDEVFVAYLCDDAQRQMLRDRGDDPDKLLLRLRRPGERGLRRPHARHDHLACISAAATSARPGWRRAATSASPTSCSTR